MLVNVSLRLLACSAATYVLWRLLGPIGIAVAAPLFGFALARPIIDLISESNRAVKHLTFSGVEGRYFNHRGFSIDVAEDERHHRWLSVTDVRKVISALPRVAVLQRQFRQALLEDLKLRGHRIQADALLSYLGKSTDADSIKFRNWLEREVVFPAAMVRRRLGIHDKKSE